MLENAYYHTVDASPEGIKDAFCAAVNKPREVEVETLSVYDPNNCPAFVNGYLWRNKKPLAVLQAILTPCADNDGNELKRLFSAKVHESLDHLIHNISPPPPLPKFPAPQGAEITAPRQSNKRKFEPTEDHNLLKVIRLEERLASLQEDVKRLTDLAAESRASNPQGAV